MPPKPAIPASEHDLTAAWMQQAMAAGGNVGFPEILDVAVEQIGVGVGMVGKILRCHLTYDGDASCQPQTVIVKLPSADRDTLRVAKRLELYRREYNFYRLVAPHAPIRSPALHYGDFDDPSNNFVLILEDLNYLATQDQIDGATEEHAKIAVRAIAQLHGQYWNRLDLLPAFFLQHSARRKNAPLVKAVYQASLRPTFERFAHAFPAPMRQLAQEFGNSYIEYTAASAADPVTLGHGDYRLDNMFFDPAGSDDLVVIDWQVCGLSSGLYDVAYFLSSSVEPQVRRSIERDLVAEYHQIINSISAQDYSLADCWRSYRRSMLACFLTPVVAAGQLDFNSQRSQRLAEAFLNRTLSAIDDLDAREFLPARRRSFSFANLSSAFYLGAYRAIKSVRRN